MSREQMIAELKKVKPSYNYNRYEDAQIFRMYQRYVLDKNTPKGDPITQQVEPTTSVEKSIEDYEKEYEDQVGYKTCNTCGTRLNDMGTCPKCDDGEEDLNEAIPSEKDQKRYPLWLYQKLEDAVAKIDDIPAEHKEEFITLVGDRATVKRIPGIGHKASLLPKACVFAKEGELPCKDYNSLIAHPEYYGTTVEDALRTIYNTMKKRWFKDTPLTESVIDSVLQKDAEKILDHVSTHSEELLKYSSFEEYLDELNIANIFTIPAEIPSIGFKVVDVENISETEAAEYIKLLLDKTWLRSRLEELANSLEVNRGFRNDNAKDSFTIGDRVAHRYADIYNVGTIKDIMNDDEGVHYQVEWDYSDGDSIEWLFADEITHWVDIKESLDNLAANDYVLTYYENNACAERRPETLEDIENDWHEIVFRADGDIDAFIEAFARVYQDEEAAEDRIDDLTDISSFIEYLNSCDWGDGSPIILKLANNEKVLYDSGYTKESWKLEYGDYDDCDDIDEIDSEVNFDESLYEEDLLHNSKLTTDIEADDDFNLEKTCVLCGNKIFGYGNNASPIADGTCCDLCNMEKVIPARLNQFRSKRK